MRGKKEYAQKLASGIISYAEKNRDIQNNIDHHLADLSSKPYNGRS